MAVHRFTQFASGGKSLHPLQRLGAVSNRGFNVQKAGGPGGMHSAPPIPPQTLTLPPTLNVSIAAASKGNVG